MLKYDCNFVKFSEWLFTKPEDPGSNPFYRQLVFYLYDFIGFI